MAGKQRNNLLQKTQMNNLDKYLEYVDDILIIFDQNKADGKTILIQINNRDKHLEFKLLEEENNTINYLDLSIHRNTNSIDLGIYRKPTYLLIYLLTAWCRALLEQLTGLQLVKKFPTFHGTRRFITTLTSVCHLSLTWASPYPHSTSWISILILSTYLRLGLPSGLLPSGFPSKNLYTPLSDTCL